MRLTKSQPKVTHITPLRWHDLGKTGFALPCPGRQACRVCREAGRQRREGERRTAA